MSAALLATATAAALAALGLLVVCSLTALPAILALTLAERRAWATARWTAVSTTAALLALAGCALVVRSLLRTPSPSGSRSGPVLALVLAACGWAAPAAVVLAGRLARARVGGRGGHE